MVFKTILIVTGLEGDDRDLKLATDLCRTADAHLSVLVVGIAIPAPIGEFPATFSDVWLQERQRDLETLGIRVAAVSAFLSTNAGSADVSSEYVEAAWADEAIGRRGRYADITLLGPSSMPDGTLKDKIIEGALFSSGKPLLLVPKGSNPTLSPKRVLVAWDGRIEAARAVREALEILVGAHEVQIVLVDPMEGENGHGEEPGADVAAYLSRHGAKVTVHRLPSASRSVSDVLCRHAIDGAAEMLVMGAYGHSRVRERIFGGVTQSMLRKHPLPIFMAR